ncbi:MAG: dual specificity protein phosphatase family protein [Actinomycetota bacterium]|nr:dual specificity protein phosphatase family protein [Actinomycetota bacterium]
MKLVEWLSRPKRMDVYEIGPCLFMSGSLARSMDYLKRGVTAVINLKEIPDSFLPKKLHWGLYLHWPIEDGPMPDAPTVRTLAKFIVGLIQDGRKVLVHCHGGNNRSGLVVARTLIEQGIPPEEAIERVRRGRGPTALSNQQFVEWLLQEGAERPSSLSLPS